MCEVTSRISASDLSTVTGGAGATGAILKLSGLTSLPKSAVAKGLSGLLGIRRSSIEAMIEKHGLDKVISSAEQALKNHMATLP